MILTIDIGNTCTKAAVFQDSRIVHDCRKMAFGHSDWQHIIDKYNIEKTIISSVNSPVCEQTIQALRHTHTALYILDHNTALPFVIDYDTPETLGRDRIAAMAGAIATFGTGNYLVVDVGTCVTYDVLADGHFVGGNIAPGLQMRLDAMNRFTSGLPKIDLSVPAGELGQSTAQALVCGAFWGVICEIQEMVERCSKRYGELQCVITGGGVEWIKKEFGGAQNIVWEPRLVAKGLNFIAQMQS